ncbi:hypothetical protein ACFQDE_03430 [Deinococcus caeni]|uniref:hypothetical protein n=1 Tax=Deinococcus caeni TaxID=569127 RepID=UPI003623EEFF
MTAPTHSPTLAGTFDAVLFDLDGVLVDSEALAADVWVRTLAEHGLPLALNDFAHLAVGQTFPNVLVRLSDLHGWTPTDAFLPTLETGSTRPSIPWMPSRARATRWRPCGGRACRSRWAATANAGGCT